MRTIISRSAVGLLTFALGTVVGASTALGQCEPTGGFKCRPTGGLKGDNFGMGVASSGNVVVVGAREEATPTVHTGAAYVFRRQGASWIQEARLLAPDGLGSDLFGECVAIDGNRVVVGARARDDLGAESGATYVFRYDGAGWVQEAKLFASDEVAGDQFGTSVAIWGEWIVAGAPPSDARGVDSGAAYVFHREAGTWVQKAKLIGSDTAAGDFFGAVAIHHDTIAVGAGAADPKGTNSGAAYVFVRQGQTWIEQAKLVPSDGAAFDFFGGTSIWGDRIAVGAGGADALGTDSGAAYIFHRVGSTWPQEAKIVPSGGAASDTFGSVALRGDRLYVGAYKAIQGTAEGAAYVFRRNGSAWSQEAKLISPDGGLTGEFGLVTAISGGRMAVGEPGFIKASGGRPARGEAAYVFRGLVTQVNTWDAINEQQHHTDKFGSNVPDTVLRRGFAADFDVSVRDDFDPAWHIEFEAVHEFDGIETAIFLPAFPDFVPPDRWGCTLVEFGPSDGGERVARMQVYAPPDAAVGEYVFRAVVKNSAGGRICDLEFDHPVVILFNPWSPADDVYLADEAERNEYVLNESGRLWKISNAGSPLPIGWTYDQFAEDTFQVTLDLLNGLSEADRSDPAKVARWFSAKINSNDGGVITGRWSGDYSGGTSPSAWTGSGEIFTKYRELGVVKYGQCWVFAGALTSSLRSLGIPTRPITNYNSAHDADIPSNKSVDKYFTLDKSTGRFEYDSSRTHDRVWNFHVWCEAAMKRTVGIGDGWQAVDATPQERSGGAFQLGPAAVSAVKAARLVDYDVPFVLAEVDADVKYYKNAGLGDVLYRTDATTVGRSMTTKVVGGTAGLDITASYKTPETPPLRSTSDFQISVPASSGLGESIDGSIMIGNPGDAVRTYAVSVTVRSVAYSGEDLGIMRPLALQNVPVPAHGAVSVPLSVPWAAIAPWSLRSSIVRFEVGGNCFDTDASWFEMPLVQVSGLPLALSINPAGVVAPGGDVQAEVIITNPLAQPATNVTVVLTGDDGLLIEGEVLSETVNLGTIAPGAAVSVVRTLAASEEGQKSIAARVFGAGLGESAEIGEVRVASCAVDFNGDGLVDFSDYLEFLNRYDAQDPSVDFNGDGLVDFSDYLEFLNLYDAGC